MAYRHIFPIADGVATTNYGVATTSYPVITANGNYPSDEGLQYEGGTGTIEVMGTFGGGTAKLQVRGIDRTTWLDVGTPTNFTANGIAGFVSGPAHVRLNVAGATAPSLYAAIRKVVGD